ncbi:MAG TPA: AMP-binding protein [Beijerinckiaceae bacterium]|nr:AMP-binding protein [Beijerinckiaceae bacterium]
MAQFYDKLETRTPAARERALMRDLRALLAASRSKAPALKSQMKGIAPETLKTRADLARIPVIRKSDLKAMQQADLPFGGLAAGRTSALMRILVSPGPIFEPEGHDPDWWGAARAFFAAGFRRGDIVQNCFSYHLTPGGHIMESGARALGCPVIPGGVGNTEQQLEAVALLKPAGYAGTPDFLKVLLDKGKEAGLDTSSLRKALVSGAAFPASLQKEIAERGIEAYQAYATAEFGIIAYETPARAGLVVNEGLIVEIVRPGTNEPVADGEIGEIVVTRLSPEYPLLRFGTGDMSKVLPGVSPCGRTNLRLAGWLGRADQTTKVKGMFVHPGQVADVGKRHPDLGRLRLVVTRANEQDVMVLKAESETRDAGLAGAVAATLQAITKLKGAVELVAPGSLPADGKVIADERPV